MLLAALCRGEAPEAVAEEAGHGGGERAEGASSRRPSTSASPRSARPPGAELMRDRGGAARPRRLRKRATSGQRAIARPTRSRAVRRAGAAGRLLIERAARRDGPGPAGYIRNEAARSARRRPGPRPRRAYAYCWVARRVEHGDADRRGAGRGADLQARALAVVRVRRGCGWRSTRQRRRSSRPANGSARMSPSTTSTRSATPSASAFASVAGAAVVRLVRRGPEVDPDGAAARQALRGADQQQLPHRSRHRGRLVAREPEPVQEPVALQQLAAPARVDHRDDGRQEHCRGQAEQLRRGPAGRPRSARPSRRPRARPRSRSRAPRAGASSP